MHDACAGEDLVQVPIRLSFTLHHDARIHNSTRKSYSTVPIVDIIHIDTSFVTEVRDHEG